VTADDFPAWVPARALGSDDRGGRAVLGRLVDASLVEALGPDKAGQRRFRLHDLVREFAGDLAVRAGATAGRAALERVADAWHALAEEAAKALNGQVGVVSVVTTSTAAAATDAHLRHTHAWFAIETPGAVALAHRAAVAGLHRQCWGLIWSCETYLRKDARTSDLISLGRLGLDAASRAPDPLGVACMSLMLAASYALQGDAETAHDHARRAVTSADEIEHGWLRAEARGVLATVYRLLGRPGEQAQTLREAIDLFLLAGDLTAAGVKLTLLAAASAQAGDETAALASYQDGITLLRGGGSAVYLAHGLRELARFHRETGSPARAVELYDECLALLREAHEPAGELCVHTELGLALLDDGRVELAAHHVDQASNLVPKVAGAPGYAAYARMGRGLLLARQGHVDAARDVLVEAAAGLDTMPSAQAEAFIALAGLLRDAGHPAASADARRAAARIANRLGAKRLIERVRA